MSVVQDHRYERINTVFTDTGFWDYVKTVGMKREDFIRAIEKAPAIKPFRYTYLHEEQQDRMTQTIKKDKHRIQQKSDHKTNYNRCCRPGYRIQQNTAH